MEYKTEVVEVKTIASTSDGGSTNKHGCLLDENTRVTLSDGRTVTIPKASTIHNGALIGYMEYSHRMCINDLTDFSYYNDKEITLKLRIDTPKLPHYIPKFMRGALIEIFTKISIVPYFTCDCWSMVDAKTISIYGKERFEEHNETRQFHINSIIEGLPDGKFAEINPFCPYYGDCISDFHENVFISNTGEEFSEMDITMMRIKKRKSERINSLKERNSSQIS